MRIQSRLCPQCGGELTRLSRKFSAPKVKDVVQWKKVQLLVSRGFLFYSIHKRRGESVAYELVEYPKTLEEAKNFVVTYERYSEAAT